MSKILKLFGSLFKSIYKVIDKIIVTPISKIVYKTSKFFNKENNKLEKFLNKSSTLLYLSLVLALVFFFLINSKVISFVENEAEIITNQPVKVEFNKEAYVIEDLPETVDITLIGRKSDLYLAKQLGENEVVLDLTDYEPRDEPYKVKLTYNQTINTLSYKLDPTYVYVTIKKKVSALKTITSDVINQDKLNDINPQISVSNIELDQSEVVVKGSQDTLDRIATVKALIDLNNSKFTQAGTYEIENLPIVAYDENGNILNNVEVVPNSVSGVVTFTSYSKEVPIKVQTTGDLVAGKAISSITINGKSDLSLKIYGEQSVIDKIVDYYENCPKCNKKIKISKREILKYPQYLIIRLARGKFEEKKGFINNKFTKINNKIVPFECETIKKNIKRYYSNQTKKYNCEYNLISRINYEDENGSIKFKSFCKSPISSSSSTSSTKNEWISFDFDSPPKKELNTSKKSNKSKDQKDNNNSEPYILFYEFKINP